MASGSGKSTLLCSLLGETIAVQGGARMRGKVSYVPQQAWIFNATVKENITFQSSLSDEAYWKVMQEFPSSAFIASDRYIPLLQRLGTRRLRFAAWRMISYNLTLRMQRKLAKRVLTSVGGRWGSLSQCFCLQYLNVPASPCTALGPCISRAYTETTR